jgi:hypothetical protein
MLRREAEAMARKLRWVAKKVSRLGPYRKELICSECGWSAEAKRFIFANPVKRKAGRELARKQFDAHECADFPKGVGVARK